MESAMNHSSGFYKVAEIELSYRNIVRISDRPKVKTSRDAYNVLLESWDKNKIEFIEQFKIILLNRASRVLGIYEVSSGGVTGTLVDPKIVFAAALKSNSSSIVLAHNHPSSNIQPSTEDINLTRKLKLGGSYLEINVLDHIIVTLTGYYSFVDEGRI